MNKVSPSFTSPTVRFFPVLTGVVVGIILVIFCLGFIYHPFDFSTARKEKQGQQHMIEDIERTYGPVDILSIYVENAGAETSKWRTVFRTDSACYRIWYLKAGDKVTDGPERLANDDPRCENNGSG